MKRCPKGACPFGLTLQLEALLTPAIFAQQGYYRQLGLRDRILNLSLMVAAVLTLLWRQVPGVQELTRLLAREDLLWCPCTKVSQQALSERFLTFPAELFERVFEIAACDRLEARNPDAQIWIVRIGSRHVRRFGGRTRRTV